MSPEIPWYRLLVTRITLTAVASAALIVAGDVGLTAWQTRRALEVAQQLQLDEQGRLLAASVQAAVAFEDFELATQTLTRLAPTLSDLELVELYDRGGTLRSHWARGRAEGAEGRIDKEVEIPSGEPGSPGGRIHLVLSTARLAGVQRSFGWSMLGLLAVTAPLILGLGLMIHRGLRPLRALAGVSHELAKGNYDLRVTYRSSDEVGQLAAAFRHLAEQLKLRERHIQSQRSSLEAEIQVRREAERAALLAHRTQSEFLAMMSHELRTPMNGVLGMAQLLEDTPLDSEQRELVDTIHYSSAVLLRILNDILDLSKFDADRMELDCAPFRLRECLKRISDILTPQAEQKGIALSITVDPEVPDGLCGDSGRLRQVLINLINNAIKFTEVGAISATVSAVHGDPLRLMFEVRDTGIGIASEHIGRIFQPFSQVESSLGRRYGGTGLGLMISKRIVEAMGGTIGVDSTVGEGTRFWFSLALERSEALERSAEPAPPSPPPDIEPGAFEHPILIVEDNPGNERFLARVLDRLGYCYEVARDGEQAVTCFDQGRWGLILMDVQMPVMTGLEATARIRELERARGGHVPIVAMTANAMRGDREACLEAGMDDYLSKPVQLDVLRAVLARFRHSAAVTPA